MLIITTGYMISVDFAQMCINYVNDQCYMHVHVLYVCKLLCDDHGQIKIMLKTHG